MGNSRDFDIVIVGGGAVGSAAASLLAKITKSTNKPLKIALIESQLPPVFDPNQVDPRVAALTEKTRLMFDQIGIWSKIVDKRACAYKAMNVWDAEGTGRITFDCQQVQQPNLGHIVENSALVSTLIEHIQQQPNIELFCPANIADYQLQEDGITLTLDNEITLSGQLLIAADGANSAVREQFQFATKQWDYGQHAIVTTITTENPNQLTAWQRFMPTGPLAFLPLNTIGDAYCCSIVWSQDTEEAERLMALDDKEFCQQLSRASEHCLGEVLKTEKRYLIPLRQSHATDYVMPRVALIGDAAHSIHPLAGQGANLGFADAQVLAEEMANAYARDLDLGDLTLLKRYQRRRKPENLATMAAMEGFKRLFGSHNSALRLLRNYGLSGINRLGAIKNTLIKQAMGL
ncbi:MAG: UbiH/UbiF/VisC/COQ6 family ubiquinone biosynthesis hydroxylase [Porticoccaceae bacterium]|nr:UbiH/UbiF/VisC/COQ6 family ubiquinone biosynthesis hydroxylase [Porticoccaceae bacterium]